MTEIIPDEFSREELPLDSVSGTVQARSRITLRGRAAAGGDEFYITATMGGSVRVESVESAFAAGSTTVGGLAATVGGGGTAINITAAGYYHVKATVTYPHSQIVEQ